MKKSVTICASLLLVCLGLTSVAQATLETGSQDWYKDLEPNESITCIAFYALGSVEFTQAPEWYEDFEPAMEYNREDDIAGWEMGLSADHKIAYLYGPRATNTSDVFRELFAFEMFYQWDTDAPDFEPDWPVYQDVVLFDGPFGSPPTFAVGRRGTPGGNWKYKDDEPESGPYQTDETYENPVPEPVTIFLLGLGAVFLRKRR